MLFAGFCLLRCFFIVVVVVVAVDVVDVVATLAVGGISVRKNVEMFCSPMVKGCMSYFKNHDLMMVVLRKEGTKLTVWNLENT